MNLLLAILLQAPAGAPSEWSKYQSIFMMVAIVAIFYFLMIRPQQKKQKAVQKAREALKTGDRVVTAGGIHGRIREVSDTTMLIEVADGVRIKVDKMSVYASAGDIQSK
ncbi:MAG: preprotein translocase subunit YajC [Tannerella sp.]|jgi:preprotein translocase subunit YajC|nr:preprotein translocase subunit YajC [Tannerella sp.]